MNLTALTIKIDVEMGFCLLHRAMGHYDWPVRCVLRMYISGETHYAASFDINIVATLEIPSKPSISSNPEYASVQQGIYETHLQLEKCKLTDCRTGYL